MTKQGVCAWAGVACLFVALNGLAQQTEAGTATPVNPNPQASLPVPRLVRFSGVVKDLLGKPLTGPVEITFAIYKEQGEGLPIWQETQVLQLDEQGRYSVLLGAMQPEGLPMELFTTGEARWLEVQVVGAEPQPRTLLVSVPYALKAADAETLGGKPASAYLLSQSAEGSAQAGPQTGSKTAPAAAAGKPTTTTAGVNVTPLVAGTGTMNRLAKWTDNSGTLGNSVLFDNGTNVGIGTTNPHAAFSIGDDPAGVWGASDKALSVFSVAAGGSAGITLGADGNNYAAFYYDGSGTPAAFKFDDVGGGAAFGLDITFNGKNIIFNDASGGNVGIGTAVPAAKLDVAGAIQSSGTVTATSFSGSGAGLTALNASNLASGTVPSGRISGTYSSAVTFSSASNSFTGSGAGLTGVTASGLAAGTYSNALTFSNASNSFTGSGAGLTALNASNLASGTVPDLRLGGTYSNPVTFSHASNSFSGNGAGLTILNASNLASGTLPSARLSGPYGNVLTFSNSGNSFSGSGAGLTGVTASGLAAGTYANALIFSSASNSFTGSFAGSGAGLTALNASNLGSGTLPSARLSGTYSNVLTFSNALNSFTGGFSGDGSSLTSLNASNLSYGLLPDLRLGGTYTSVVNFNNSSNTFTGIGSGLTNVTAVSATNALNLNSVAAVNYARRDVGNTFSGTQSITGNVSITGNLTLSGSINSGLLVSSNATSPNVVGGYSGNSITSGVVGAAVGGGGASTGYHRVTDDYGTVGGGYYNLAGDNAGLTNDRLYATVGGGTSNRASGTSSTVGGGNGNSATGTNSTVGGGDSNTAGTGSWTTVGGGFSNTASSDYATVGGGSGNSASGTYATVAGGGTNSATKSYATVPGGYWNTATGIASFAAGNRARASHDGAFVWGDSTDADVASTATNQFIVRASGGVWFGTSSSPSWPSGAFIATSTGAYLSTGGHWTNSSDRNLKEHFSSVDGLALLARLSAIPIQTWNYRVQDASIRHLGPMAQDFHAAFGLGEDNKHIGTVDADGVALAAIQALYKLSLEKDEKIEQLSQQVMELRARLARLEQAPMKK